MSLLQDIYHDTAPHLRNPCAVTKADTWEDAVNVMSRAMSPHRLRLIDREQRALTCVSSVLDLLDCALVSPRAPS